EISYSHLHQAGHHRARAGPRISRRGAHLGGHLRAVAVRSHLPRELVIGPRPRHRPAHDLANAPATSHRRMSPRDDSRFRPTAQAVGIPLAPTLSPQPWLSAEAFLWLVAGLAWTAWLLGHEWNPAARASAMRILAGGIVLVAAAALAAWWLHFRVPGWHAQRGF